MTRARGAGGAPHPHRDDALVQLSLTTRADRPHKASILVTAALLFASGFVLRLTLTEPEAGLGFMFVLPIALLALHFGARAGLPLRGRRSNRTAGSLGKRPGTWIWASRARSHAS